MPLIGPTENKTLFARVYDTCKEADKNLVEFLNQPDKLSLLEKICNNISVIGAQRISKDKPVSSSYSLHATVQSIFALEEIDQLINNLFPTNSYTADTIQTNLEYAAVNYLQDLLKPQK